MPFQSGRATHPVRPTRLADGLGLKVPRFALGRICAPKSSEFKDYEHAQLGAGNHADSLGSPFPPA